MQADAASDAAQTAADASKFKPFGVTTRFGKSGFQYDAQGNPIGAGYQAAPDVAAMREGLMNLAGGGLQQAVDARNTYQDYAAQAMKLGGLGAQYLAQSPQEASSQWMSQQQGLLQPSRDQAYARMQQNLFNTGRGGLSISQGAGLKAANPEAQAYYNSLAQQDAQLAAQAQQAGQQQATFGAGLLGASMNTLGGAYDLQAAALKPWQANFNAAMATENAAQGALDMGSSLGAAQSTAGARAAPYLASQGISPGGTALMNLAQTPGLFSGFGGGTSSAYALPTTGTGGLGLKAPTSGGSLYGW
jgi:hypothetical protein